MSKKSSRRRQARRALVRGAAPARTCGRYELLGELGSGGMAEILRARITGIDGFRRDVILKRLHAANAADPEFVGMFKDEARILGELRHQNVVQALDFGEEDGRLFLVLEYIEGPSLARVMRARPEGISPAVVAYIGREICHALDYVHRFRDADGTPLGLIHRDVTPSNVIVTPTGAVKLLDFGVAKFAKASQATRAGTVKGKTAYVAPEQLTEGRSIDGRVDLFALGTMLHELVVGKRLFAAEHDLASLKKITELKIPLPSILRPGVPPSLDRVIMKALQRDPERRYANAAAMARELDEIVLSARLRADEVGALMREIVTPPPPPPSPPAVAAKMVGAPTAVDIALPVRMWMRARWPGRTAMATGLGLILGLTSALGLGMKLQRVRDARASRARVTATAARPVPARALAAAGLEPQLPVAPGLLSK
jgi:serine/threonine protein kinase